MVKELEVEDIFSSDALETLELLSLKCKVSEEHCITLLEVVKKKTEIEGEKKMKKGKTRGKDKKVKKGGPLSRIYYELSDELQAVVGKKKANRPEIMKGLWKYIKAENLQDPDDKRTIVFDEKFAAVFGGKKCDMFFLAKGISKHLKRI